jgi:uncharacterized protein
MLQKLALETIENVIDTLPVDITFLDDTDTVRYYSRGDQRIFKRSPSVIGKRVQDCHPQKSLAKVEQVISELKSGKRSVAEFWIDHHGRKIYIRYFPVKDKLGKYIGTLEVSQDITELQKITSEKRLLNT